MFFENRKSRQRTPRLPVAPCPSLSSRLKSENLSQVRIGLSSHHAVARPMIHIPPRMAPLTTAQSAVHIPALSQDQRHRWQTFAPLMRISPRQTLHLLGRARTGLRSHSIATEKV
jgi:hypothetical protein